MQNINSKKQSLRASFTSKKKTTTSQTDVYQIGRYAIKNWNGTVFKEKLNDWFAKEQKEVQYKIACERKTPIQ
jgi:hypothetical protein